MITGDPKDILAVKELGSPTSVAFKSWEKYTITGLNESNINTATEDVGCNLIAANVKNKRFVASIKKKSYFAEIIK